MIGSWSCVKPISYGDTPWSMQATNVQTVLLSINGTLTPNVNSKTPDDGSCWPIMPLGLKNNIPGQLLFFSPSSKEKTNIVVWDISSQTHKILQIPVKKSYGSWSVSTEGKVLSLFSEQNLLQISGNNIESIQIPKMVENNVQSFVVNNTYPEGKSEIVFLVPYSTNEPEVSGITGQLKEIPFFLFDPIQKTLTRKTVALPDINLQENRLPPIYFSPDMKYVLYENRSGANGQIFYSIYDLAKSKVKLRFPSESDHFTTTNGLPHWLPGENKVSAELYNQDTGERDYYVISLDGKITKTISAKEIDGYSSAYIRNPRMDWSPDMNYLAVADIHNNLGIWDDQAKQLYQTCFPGENLPTDPIQPDWSFDGNYIQLSIRTVSQEEVMNSSGKTVSIEKSTVMYYLVDIAGKVIYEMPEELSDDSKTGSFISWVNW